MPSEGTVQERFCRAWGAIHMPEKDGENPHFKTRYATLAATLTVIREACKEEGLAYVQRLSPEGEGWMMHSQAVAPDGRAINLSSFPIEITPNVQTFGSNLTYAKRQQAQADWGITGDDDDDGEAGAQAASKAPQKRQQKPSDDGLLDAAKQRLWDACKAYGAAHGMEAKSVLEGVQKRPDYAETPEWLSMAAIELEEANKADA